MYDSYSPALTPSELLMNHGFVDAAKMLDHDNYGAAAPMSSIGALVWDWGFWGFRGFVFCFSLLFSIATLATYNAFLILFPFLGFFYSCDEHG